MVPYRGSSVRELRWSIATSVHARAGRAGREANRKSTKRAWTPAK